MESSSKENVLNYLYSLEKFGIKLGLHNICALLETIDNPQNGFKSIHVAGTNGKGSVCSIIASILQEYGFKVGLYTSPHLIDFNERIKINGIQINNRDLVKYTGLIKDRVDELRATFFEATTAIAFKYFFDERVDYAVIETGLGGRLDSTNVLYPEVSVITDISIDHTDQLGNTIEKIASEKAGIIKKSIECITGSGNGAALKILNESALKNNSALSIVKDLCSYEIKELKLDKMFINLKCGDIIFDNFISPLCGKHQAINICTSILAFLKIAEKNSISINENYIKKGIQNTLFNTNLRCRIELVNREPDILFDVAHNFDAINKLISFLSEFEFRKIFLLFGIMRDKEYEMVINSLSEIISDGFSYSIGGERALESGIITDLFKKNNVSFNSGTDTNKDMVQISEKMEKGDLLLVTGSHYICGEFLQLLSKRKIPLTF